MEDATVLDLDLLGVIPTFSPRKIELTTKEQKKIDMSNMLYSQLISLYLKCDREVTEECRR